MTKDRTSITVPPSVGQFAVGERQQLLDENARLKADLELAMRGVENCEMYREREGKEGVIAAMAADNVELFRQQLADQAREFERLKDRISTRNINLANATCELAALKSQQPSGLVVHPFKTVNVPPSLIDHPAIEHLESELEKAGFKLAVGKGFAELYVSPIGSGRPRDAKRKAAWKAKLKAAQLKAFSGEVKP